MLIRANVSALSKLPTKSRQQEFKEGYIRTDKDVLNKFLTLKMPFGAHMNLPTQNLVQEY